MTTYNRVAGNLVFQSVGNTDTVTFEGLTANAATVVINGNLSVTGNAALTGNISGDNIFNGTTSIAIPTASGNAVISVGGVSNVAVWSTTGVVITGTESVTGNVTGGNVLTAGLISATGNVSGGNIVASSNIILSYTSGATTDRILRFSDANTAMTTVGANIGAIEWFTSDAAPGSRVTAAIRAVYSDSLGNANILIQTANTTAATRIAIIGASGNVGIANTAPLHTFAVSGTMYGSSTLTIVGNIDGGNLSTAGLVTATGNVTGGNVATAGLITATGNITGGNLISVGAIGAGAGGISTTGNVTGGNLVSQGVITSTGNITSGNVFIGTTASLTANVNAGNAVITSNVSGANVSIGTLLTGNGIGVPNFVVQSSDAPISSATPANIGTLTFTAAANNRYSFVGYVTLVPDGSMTISPSVNFSSGTCNFTTETQTTGTSAFATATKTTSDDVATTYASTGTVARTLRISGIFFNTVDTAVTMRLQNSTGTITAKTGSYLTFTKVA